MERMETQFRFNWDLSRFFGGFLFLGGRDEGGRNLAGPIHLCAFGDLYQFFESAQLGCSPSRSRTGLLLMLTFAFYMQKRKFAKEATLRLYLPFKICSVTLVTR